MCDRPGAELPDLGKAISGFPAVQKVTAETERMIQLARVS
jgi:hypothetical protein